jgi:DNA-binding SARP family transcriptional activator
MEFLILGPLEVREGGRSLPLGGPRQRALLALLLLHANAVVSSDRLLDELWGEEAPESGAAALRVRVSQLRKLLPGDVLQTRPSGYLLRVDPDQLDLDRFERLAEGGRRALEEGDAAGASGLLGDALVLWRGPALADLSYEDFAQPAIARLEELRLAAHELRIEADLALGRDAALVAELEELVAGHPLRERLRGYLMLALYRSGRQAEALEAYHEARRTLVEELGIEPGPALQDLEKAILRHDPSLAREERSPASRVEAAPHRSIVVAAFDETHVESLLGLAGALARHPPREVILARLLSDHGELGPATARLHEGVSDLAERGVIARAAAFTSEQPGDDLARLAVEQDVDLLLLDAPAALLEQGLPDPDLARVLALAPCDIALAVARSRGTDGAVLVPFGAAEHDWAAVELGAWIARAWAAPLRLLGAMAAPGEGKRDASRMLSHASLAVQRALGVVAEPVLVAPGEQGILAASADARLLVVGLSARWHREGLGPARLAFARHAMSPVLLVRRGLRPGGLAPPASLTRFTWSVRS